MPRPKPTPTKLKALKGNPGKRPLNKDEPEFTEIDDKPPGSLGKIGMAEWVRVVDEMRESGVLTKVDEKILWGYCHHFSIAERAVNEMAKTKLILKSPNGYPIQNPYLSIQNKSLSMMKSFAAELGITPSSRSGITKVPTKQEDPMAALKKRRAERLAAIQKELKSGNKPNGKRKR